MARDSVASEPVQSRGPLRDPHLEVLSPRELDDAIEGWREIVAKHQKGLDDAQGILDNLLAVKEARRVR